jgi:membrane protein
VLASTSLTAFLRLERFWEDPPGWVAWIYGIGLGFVPLVLIWIAFTLMYKVMPHVKTRWIPCLIAGAVAGSLFIFAQWVYISFQVGVSRANAIYGAFAAIPLLLIYMHVSFQILLLGAEIAFGIQHVNAFRSSKHLGIMSYAMKREIGLAVMDGVCRCFEQGGGQWKPEQLAVVADFPIEWVSRTVEDLVGAGLLVKAEGGEKTGYVPARSPGKLSALEVLRAMRGRPAEGYEHDVLPETLRKDLELADRAQEELLGRVTFGGPG